MPDDREALPWDEPVFCFGGCVVNSAARELSCNGLPVHLEPKAFDLLVYLIGARDRVVTKDELLEHIWKTRFVSESALSHMIMKVRRAIGECAGAPGSIQTRRRVGYRFAAAVRLERSVRAIPGPVRVASWGGDRPAGLGARGIFQKALGAAASGRAELALAYCLECAVLEPGSIAVRARERSVNLVVAEQADLAVLWCGSDQPDAICPSVIPG
jgi:DNA-binding winged helix-turn-helix (wHTH) protein